MKNTKFYLGKLVAIAIIVLGIHLMVAYQSKMLPFGIISENTALLGVWGYTGWALALVAIGGGLVLFFLEAIDYFIKKYL